MEGRTDLSGPPPAARRAYQLALACGGLPLAAGTSIFLLWLVGRWEWLMYTGLLTMEVGCVLFLVGLGFLVRFWVLAWRSPNFPRRRARRMTAGAMLLLAANFPTATGIVAAAVAVDSCYSVVIKNHSPSPLEAVRVSGGGCEVDFGRIEPGGTRRRWFWVQHDGELTLHAKGGVASVEATVDGYVTGLGGHAVVTVGPDGAVSVVNASDRSRSAWYSAE